MNYNLVINGLASHFKGRFVQTHTLTEKESEDIQTSQTTAVGVVPRESYLGAYYNTDLGLGLTEQANDILIKSAVCSVKRKKTIQATVIAGRNGTVKELISANDYEITLTFTLLKTDDEYPAEAMREIATLANENSAVFIDSAFLRLFDIDRAVIKELNVDQTTYGNMQEVTLELDSDDDYEVEVRHSV